MRRSLSCSLIPILLRATLLLAALTGTALAQSPAPTQQPTISTVNRLPAVPGMPAWARQLYREDVPVNVWDIEREFEAWKAAELQGSPAEERSHEGWIEYYERWRREVEPYRTPEGTLDARRVVHPVPVDQEALAASVIQINWQRVTPTETFKANDGASPMSPRAAHANVQSISVSLSNPNILFCGTETGIVSRTDDKGQNWVTKGQYYTGFNGPVGAIAIHPSNPDSVYVGTRAGVSRTANGGNAWAIEFSNPGKDVNALAIRPDVPTQILCASDKLWRRTAPGGAWSAVINFPTYDVMFHPTNPNIVYALVAQDTFRVAMWRSTNAGASFAQVTSGWLPPTGVGGGRLAVSPADAGRVYAALVTNSGICLMRSNNAAVSWATVAASPITDFYSECTGDVVGPLRIGFGQGFYDLALTVSPTNADHLVLGVSELVKSLDGGNTFRLMRSYCQDPGPLEVHTDFQQFVTLGTDSWLACDGGVSLSTDFWTTNAAISHRNRGLAGTNFWGFGQGWNEDTIVGGLYHNGDIARLESYPAGQVVHLGGVETATGQVNPGDSRMVYFADNQLYGEGSRIQLPATIEGDTASFMVARWPNVEDGFLPMHAGELEWDPRYSSTYYIGSGPGLYRTEDNGRTFIFLGQTNAVDRAMHFEVSRVDPNVIYTTYELPTTGRLFRSSNRGGVWTSTGAPAGITAQERKYSEIALSGTDANELWWAFAGGPDGAKIFHTTNGGSTWTNITTPALNGIRIHDMVHQLGTNGGIYIVGDFGKVFYRDNSMSGWAPWSAGLPAQMSTEIARLKIFYPGQKLRVASVDGVWEIPLALTSTTTLVQPMASRESVLSPCDTLQFESYSVTNGPATYHWDFSPKPFWVSNPDARNPKVIMGPAAGSLDVTLTITDLNGTTTRTIPAMVANPNAPTVQWASGVSGFSSEFGAPWSASAALGAPDVFPNYGDLGNTWASLTQDGQREYLSLTYATPQLIDFVQVAETYSPGAIEAVSVKNPGTGRFDIVWAQPAAPAPPVARLFTMPFAQPSYPVSEVRLDIDSPAVPDWNEIDAVGIGRCGCSLAPVVLEGPPPVLVNPITALENSRPNPFRGSTEINFTLAKDGPVRLEVFNVTGQRVTPLIDRKMSAGRHSLRWDGHDASGKVAATGVYYLRLETADQRAVRKIVKLR